MAFTLDTYTHVMPGMQPEAVELFMDLILGSDNDRDEELQQESSQDDGQEETA